MKVIKPSAVGACTKRSLAQGNAGGIGFRLPSALDNRPLKFENGKALRPQMIFVSATPGRYDTTFGTSGRTSGASTGLVIQRWKIRPVRTQVDDVLSRINLARGAQ